jgi:hypothetical protein
MPKMKTSYAEGPEALANFKHFATAILQATPNPKKKQVRKPASQRKPKKSDRDQNGIGVPATVSA